MCKCVEMNDESKVKLAVLIPETENYFGDDVGCYDELYEVIEAYMAGIGKTTKTLKHAQSIAPLLLKMAREINLIHKLMRVDGQNEMVDHLCCLSEMLKDAIVANREAMH